MAYTTSTSTPATAGLYVQPSSLTDRQTSSTPADPYDPATPLAFPLKHTDVKAKISGNISRVEVTQTFENPFTQPLEATYVFPLPDEAAVDTMTIRLGDRTIQGRIEKREDAQAIYEQAKQEGRTAGLLEQERANIFTQSLANIRPGEQIQVVITYSDSLPYKQGRYEFVFPMVVGPRYIPGHPIEAYPHAEHSTEDARLDHGSAPAPMTLNQDTGQVPDASRLNGPILPAGTRSGHDIQVTVDIEMGGGTGISGAGGSGIEESEHGGIQLSNLHSTSHQIRVDTLEDLTRITLAPNDTIPNKDLILRYQVAGADTQTSVMTQADERGGHFAVYLIPAVSYDAQQYIPKDMFFLIDTSGSQSGPPLAQCQALMRRFIEGLHPQDTFNIVNFANTTQQLSQIPLDNTPRNRQRALAYVDSLRAGGGTEMLRGLKTVLNLPQQPLPQQVPFQQSPFQASNRIRNVVLLTDGYIGNETQIFAEVQRSLSPATRLHSFGAGGAVNRFLLNRVAEFGRGISHVVRHDQLIDQVVDTFFGQINNPVLGNLSLRWEGPGEAPELYPMAPPDLFAEEPLVLFGRKGDRQSGVLRLTGISGNGVPFEQSFRINFAVDADHAGNGAIAQLWGRARIKELMNQMVSGETTQGVEAVTQTALDYQLLSQYTAFVAVSDEVRVEQSNEELSINVPVNMPDSVSYEGVFGAMASPGAIASSTSMTASMASVSRVRVGSAANSSPAPVRARPLVRKAAPAQPSSFTRRLGGLFKKKAKPAADERLASPAKPNAQPTPPHTPPMPQHETLSDGDAWAEEVLGQDAEMAYEDTTLQADINPSEVNLSDLKERSSSDDKSLSVPPLLELPEEGAIEVRAEAPSGVPSIPASTTVIAILEAEGLEEDVYRLLEQHLQAIHLDVPTGLLDISTGKCLVFDIVLKKGRVKRLMLDTDASDSLESALVHPLRQALLVWQCPQLSLSSLRLTLQINTQP